MPLRLSRLRQARVGLPLLPLGMKGVSSPPGHLSSMSWRPGTPCFSCCCCGPGGARAGGRRQGRSSRHEPKQKLLSRTYHRTNGATSSKRRGDSCAEPMGRAKGRQSPHSHWRTRADDPVTNSTIAEAGSGCLLPPHKRRWFSLKLSKHHISRTSSAKETPAAAAAAAAVVVAAAATGLCLTHGRPQNLPRRAGSTQTNVYVYRATYVRSAKRVVDRKGCDC